MLPLLDLPDASRYWSILSESNFGRQSYTQRRRMNLTDHIQRAVMKTSPYPPFRWIYGAVLRSDAAVADDAVTQNS